MLEDLSNKSIEELNGMLLIKKEKIFKLGEEIKKESNVAKGIEREIVSRDKWYSQKVVNEMLSVLESRKKELSDESYETLFNSIMILIKDKNSINVRKKRTHCIDSVVKRIYFDLNSLIISKIRKHELIERMRYGRSLTKCQFVFDFDSLNNKITKKYTTTIFSKGTSNPLIFKVNVSSFSHINKKMQSFTQEVYTNYNDIIQDMIKIAKFLDDDFENELLAHKMSLSQ